MLELLGYRSNKCVTDSAMSAGFGVPRWNGFTMQDDWNLDRVVAAIRTAVQDIENPAIANAPAAAIGRQQGRERVLARKRQQVEEEAARRLEEEAVVSTLYVELRALQTSDPRKARGEWHCFRKLAQVRGSISLCRRREISFVQGQQIGRPEAELRCSECGGVEMARRGWAGSFA
jgi:hypothetical protein